MTNRDIVRMRLRAQGIVGNAFRSPADVVRTLGAVQAQDYLGALWAVGLRVPGSTEPDVERALAGRTILRTWPMRGTLHVVAAEDARWMLELLTPRVIARAAGRYRQLGLDDAVFTRCRKAIERALRGGRQLSRAKVYDVFNAAGVPTDESRGLHILGWLAQKGVVCFGARELKQQTIVLLEEWAPGAKRLGKEEALAEHAARYFTGHGPASLRDFVWWTGLSVTEARAALAAAAPGLERDVVGEETYWFAPSGAATEDAPARVHLLPVYDEFAVAYRDRSAILDPEHVSLARNGIFGSIVIADGRIVGTWKRALAKGAVGVSTSLFAPLPAARARDLAAATARYAAFLGLPPAIQ